MDMKKKLEEAYLPDKDSRRRRAVVGLSGGIHSFVTAYLLKIQKYDLIGVTVITGGTNLPAGTFSCQITPEKLTAIKDFCQTLGISHTIVDGSGDFKEEVLERWISSKLSVKWPSQCWNCHELRMKLLFEKAMELQIPNIATGHFAKLYKHESHKTVYVHSSNDEVNDQSALLSRLPHEILDHLLLPLSDLQDKEVLKLAENFGLMNQGLVTKKICLSDKVSSAALMETLVPRKFVEKGDIYDAEGERLMDHQGIHHYTLGEDLNLDPNAKKRLTVTNYVPQIKKIVAQDPAYFVKQRVILTDCKVAEETPWSEAMRGVLQTVTTRQVECWIYPKNLNSALVELDAEIPLYEGEVMTIFRKKGKNAKVYLSGIVRYIHERVIKEGESALHKIAYGRDF